MGAAAPIFFDHEFHELYEYVFLITVGFQIQPSKKFVIFVKFVVQ